MAKLWLVTGIELQDFGNVAVLEVLECNRQVLKRLEHLLHDLIRRIAPVWILQEPFLEKLAASQL